MLRIGPVDDLRVLSGTAGLHSAPERDLSQRKPGPRHRHGNRRLLDGSNGARAGVWVARGLGYCARTASHGSVLGFNFTAVLRISMRLNRRNSERPPGVDQELPPIMDLSGPD